jgi:hypothetical protein
MNGINDLIDRRIEAERKLISGWLFDIYIAAPLAGYAVDMLDLIQDIANAVERGEYKQEGNGG